MSSPSDSTPVLLPNAIPIRLKRKYLTSFTPKKNKHTGDRSGKSKRNKLNDAAKKKLAPQPKKVMVLDLRKNGKRRMVLASEVQK